MSGVLGRIFDFSQKFQSILETFAEHLITFLFEAKRSEKTKAKNTSFGKKRKWDAINLKKKRTESVMGSNPDAPK